MKKILFMVSSFNVGGVEKSLLSLLAAMPKEECEITILALEKKGGFLDYVPKWVRIEEVNWFEDIKTLLMASPYEILGLYRRQGAYTKVMSFILHYFLAKHLKNRGIYLSYLLKQIHCYNEAFDIAIAYPGPTEIIDTYIIHKIKADKKIGWIHFDISQVKPNLKLYSKLYKKFDKLFIVSEEAKQKMLQSFPHIENKVEVFKNIISSYFIQDLAKQSVTLDQDYTGTKIITVGRLSYEKGQDLAIKVLAKLRNEGEEVRWYCIGEGSSRAAYEKLIKEYGVKEHFILLGAMINPYPYMQQADLYVQTSRHEGFCLTLAEARCLGNVIVTTNFTGANEQVRDNETGFIVEAEEEMMYKKIQYILHHKEERIRVGQNLQSEVIDTTGEVSKLIDYIGVGKYENAVCS